MSETGYLVFTMFYGFFEGFRKSFPHFFPFWACALFLIVYIRSYCFIHPYLELVMPLKLMVRKGKLVPFWYARFTGADGKSYEKNTGVKIMGTPPESLRELGDETFERSRTKAQAKLERMQEDARRLGRAEDLIETLVQIRSGEKQKLWKVGELEGLYREYSRAGERQLQNSSVVFRRFVEFAGAETNVHGVSLDTVKRFFASLERPAEGRGVLAYKTRKTYLKTLSAVFGRALPSGFKNPFDEMVIEEPKDEDGRKVSGEIHRAPLSLEELNRLFVVSLAEDPELYPAVVIAAQTGLRKGDVMGLRWSDVHLEGKRSYLKLTTGKTGAEVQIPCFPQVREVLEGLAEKREKGAVHVLPELWEVYKSNPDGLTYRLKKLFVRMEESAGGGSPAPVDELKLARKGRKWIGENVTGEKGERMKRVFNLYVSGMSLPEVAETLEVSKGTASNYLHEIQAGTGLQVLRWSKGGSQREKVKRTQVQRENGSRAGSVRDWHCLRTTFCTQSLEAGVSEMLLRKITGHSTLDLVLKHYFQPDVVGLHEGFASVVKAWGAGGGGAAKRRRGRKG